MEETWIFDFIAHARTDIPDLLAYVAELEAIFRKLAESVKKYQARYHGAEHAQKHWEEAEEVLQAFKGLDSSVNPS